MAIPYKPKAIENGNASSTTGDPAIDNADDPTNSSQPSSDYSSQHSADALDSSQQTAKTIEQKTTTGAAPAEETAVEAQSSEKSREVPDEAAAGEEPSETTTAGYLEEAVLTSSPSVEEATPAVEHPANKGANPGDKSPVTTEANLWEECPATTETTPGEESLDTTEASLGEEALASKETGPGEESSATTETRSDMESSVLIDINRDMKNQVVITASAFQSKGLIAECTAAEVKETSTEVEEMSTEVTEMATDVKKMTTEAKDTTIQVMDMTTGVKDTTTEVKDTTTKDKDSTIEVKDTTTEVKNTTTKDKDTTTEVKDTTTEVKDTTTEVKETTTEVKDTTTKDKDTTTEVKDTTTEVKDTTTEVKETTTEVKDTITEVNDSDYEAMNITAEPGTAVSPFSVDKAPRGIRPPPGFNFLPKLTWPVSERLWSWAAGPRAGTETPPPPPQRPTVVTMYGVLIDPNMETETADNHLSSKPKGGARKKVRTAKKTKRKPVYFVTPMVNQNGTTTANGSINSEFRPAPDIGPEAAEPESAARGSPDSVHTKLDLGRLRCGRPSPRRLAAAVSSFQEQCAAVCEAAASCERRSPGLVRADRWETETRQELHSGVWWRRQLQQRVRRRGRIGRWFERRFERGVVLCNPPPPAKYTGFSTARASDFKSLDPKVFSRGSATELGKLWACDVCDSSTSTTHTTAAVSKLLHLNMQSSAAPSFGSCTSPTFRAASIGQGRDSATPESSVIQASSDNTPEVRRQSDEHTEAVTTHRDMTDGHSGENEPLDDEAQQEDEMMADFTERYLHQGGSLVDILNMVNNPQKVVQTALGVGEFPSSVPSEPSKASHETVSAVGEAGAGVGRAEGTNDGAQDTIKGTGATLCKTTDDVRGSEGAVGGLGAIPSEEAGLEVIEAIAMELDHQQAFTSDEPAQYESRIGDIDIKMRRLREKNDFIQQGYARITQDVDCIRQTLPEIGDMFATLQNFSAAMLSEMKKEEKTKRKPFPGGELPEQPPQQIKLSENKPTKSAKKKSGCRKRSQDTCDGASSTHPKKKTADRQGSEQDHAYKTGARPKLENNAKASPDNCSGGKYECKNSKTVKIGMSSPTRAKVERVAADSPSASASARRTAASEFPRAVGVSEFPRAVGVSELRPVTGLPPPGTYIAQHIHLVQPADSQIARSETGEERTDILSPIGLLAWAMPHRYMSSTQLLEVHSLLRGENAGDGKPMDTLRWVQDSGGQYIDDIQNFFKFGLDRRYHHIKLKGTAMALNKISSCPMSDYLRIKHWQWPALVSPNTFVSGRGRGDGVAPNPYRTNAEIEDMMEAGDVVRVSGITAYIRAVVRHICENLVWRLKQRPVTCAEERHAVSGLLTVLLHRCNEAAREPAGIVLMYSMHNDSVLEGELRHTGRFVRLRCESHSVPIGCPAWSCQLWLWLLHQTCSLTIEGESKFVTALIGEEMRARRPTGNTPPPSYLSATTPPAAMRRSRE